MARYALVVGISQYCSPLKSLEKTATDAEAVAQVLEDYGDFVEVKRLPSRRNPQTQKREVVAKAVTGAELGQALRILLQEQARQNEALIYFTGHGIIASGNLGQPRGYLATSDCEIEADGKQIISQKHGIGFDELNDLISQSDLSSLVVLLDCCHSGDFLERNLINRTFNAFSSQKDYYLITAGRSFQPVYARRNEKHSVFTGALLRGLAAENADSERRVSGARLFDHISRELRGSEQEPLCLGWGKSLTLVTHPPLVVSPTVDVPATTAVNRENPYLGLRAFDSGQADYFFGRILAVRALLDRLNTGRFLAVIGPSGCGKSSLVKAGLVPELKSDRIPGSSQWTVESFTPGTRPLESLQKALEQQQNQPLLLFIDQFEEVFTLCEDETERKDFISRITEEVTTSNRFTRVIVAMRGDFLDRCAAYQEAAILINRTQPTTYFVTPFTLPELEEVIEKPADKHRVTFERGLVPQIIADVMNQPGGLPLLQYALAELWRVCITESPGESQLTCKGYEQIRGVKGALEKRANDLYQNLAPADKVFVRRLFLSLVQLGEAQEVTRRRASWQDLEVEADSQEQLSRVTRQLASQEQRLIITDENTVEVAHEALLSEWGRLKEWIEQDRENLRLSRRLEAECKEWQKNDCSQGLLLTDAWLAAINDWVEKTQPRLSQLEQEFLQRSLEKRDRELQAKVEQERQLREAAEARAKAEAEKAEQERARALAEIEKAMEANARADAQAEKAIEAKARVKAQKQRTQIAVVLSSVAVALALLLAQAQRKQTQEAYLGEITAMVKSSEIYWRTNNQLEALEASIEPLKKLQNNKVSKEKTEELTQRLLNVISEVRERNRWEGHATRITSISYSPNSQNNLIASASTDGTIKLWKPNGTELKTKPMKHDDDVWSVTFNPDGDMLASASEDQTIKIWKLDGVLINTIHKQSIDDYVNYVTFSPNKKILAAASDDGTVRLWDLNKLLTKSVQKPRLLAKHQRPVWSVAFSHDSKLLASASSDGTVRLWRVDNGAELAVLVGHQERVNSVSFGADNQTLASASNDKTIKVWKWKLDDKNWTISNLRHQTIGEDSDRVLIVRYGPDFKSIAAAGISGTIKIWKPEDHAKVPDIKGHKGQVSDLSFSLKGDVIVTAGRDRTIRVWDVNSTELQDRQQLITSLCSRLQDYFRININRKINQDSYNACNLKKDFISDDHLQK